MILLFKPLRHGTTHISKVGRQNSVFLLSMSKPRLLVCLPWLPLFIAFLLTYHIFKLFFSAFIVWSLFSTGPCEDWSSLFGFAFDEHNRSAFMIAWCLLGIAFPLRKSSPIGPSPKLFKPQGFLPLPVLVHPARKAKHVCTGIKQWRVQ